MAEILPIRRKTLSNQSINQSIIQYWGGGCAPLKSLEYLRVLYNIMYSTIYLILMGNARCVGWEHIFGCGISQGRCSGK